MWMAVDEKKMSSIGPETLMDSNSRAWKRKASDFEDDESPMLETISSRKTKLKPKKKRPPSTFSDYTTGSEDEERTDSSCFGSPLSSDEARHYKGSKWDNSDLVYLNIFFEKTPEPFENFIKEVKDAFMKREGFCPDPSKMIDILTKQLEENLTFSYDLGEVQDIQCASAKDVMDAKEKMSSKINGDIQRMQENSEPFDPENQFCKSLHSAVGKFALETAVLFNSAARHFARETDLLLKMVLREPVSSSKGNAAGPGKNYLQNYCKVFGKIFFLSEGELPLVSFTLKNRTMRKRPDITYPFYSKTREGELLFITEVKEGQVRKDTTNIEELIGTKLMGQGGIELIGQLRRSAFYPNCLGILCMETKLIFVFLQVSKEHAISICKGGRGSADDPGRIIYTQPFDILKAEERLKMVELLFWLGCLQDPKKYNFL